MTQLTLAQAKDVCSVAQEYTGDDSLLMGYVEAAERHVAKHVRKDLDSEYPDGWPADIMQAVRLLVASFYTYRESMVVGASATTMPFGVRELLAPHRDLSA